MKTKEAVKVHCRWMIRRDMPEVFDIENGSFKSPWNEEDFLRALRCRATIGCVAEHGETVVAFSIYRLQSKFLEIVNLAVHPKWRHMGIGTTMVNKLKSKLSSHRKTRLHIILSETNLDAHLFFKACGFVALEVMRGHFENGDDGYKFVYRLA
jgi:ribosomal-protein-alanine N-acetyltransferase